MSLHDVDKTSDDRGAPSPNRPDQIIDGANKAHGTLSTVFNTNATQTPNTRVVFKHNLQLFYDDQNRIIGVMGFIPSLANYPVLIIANYGYDVYTDILGIPGPSN